MTYIYVLASFSILVILMPWLWRYQLRPYFEKSELENILKKHPQGEILSATVKLLCTLYRGIDADRLSRLERARLRVQEDAFVYGEIDFLSFMLLLDKIEPKKGEIFYDLGGGAGKAVFTVALSYDLKKACSIELLPALCQLTTIQINKAKTLLKLQDKKIYSNYLQRLAAIEVLNTDFLKTDFSDGDIIFINATCLNYYTWQSIVEKLKSLKNGSRIIVTSKKIEDEQFENIYQGRELMSWGMNTVNIYKKIS